MKRSAFTDVLPAYFYAALILFLGSIKVAPPLPHGLDYGDKYQHCLAFGLFQFLVYRALRFSRPTLSRPRGHLIAVLVASVGGAVLEVWQSMIPWRSSELLDWIADTLGAVIAAGVALLLARASRRAAR